MDSSPKAIRRLLFALGEVEEMLRSARRGVSAEALSKLMTQSSAMPPEEFVNEARMILEGALLGERDLPTDLIGAILQAMESVDSLLRT